MSARRNPSSSHKCPMLSLRAHIFCLALALVWAGVLIPATGSPGFAGEPVAKAATKDEETANALAPPLAKVPVPTKRISAGQPEQVEDTVALQLEVTYLARLLVPAGSELTVDAFDKDGKAIANTRVTTPDTNATIPVRLDISGNAGFPLRIDASLKSEFGHLLTGTQTVEAKAQAPVSVALKVVDADQ